MKVKVLLSLYFREMIGIIAGAIAGFGYWYFIGCASGTCPITGNPWISSLYGATMGYLLMGIIKPNNKHNN